MRPIGKIRYITLHASDTYHDMDVGVEDIRRWHLDRGWSDIGYHYVIRRDGTWETGRADTLQGAHVGGFNAGNLGICLIGGKSRITEGPVDNFTDPQWFTLFKRMKKLHGALPDAIIMGHNGFPGHEARGCPCFDWRRWRNEFHKRLHTTSPQLPPHWYDELDVE